MKTMSDDVRTEDVQEEPQSVTLEQAIIILAKEVEKSNPIDWMGMDTEREVIYAFLASKFGEYIRSESFQKFSEEEQKYVLMASCLNLMLQVFINEKKSFEMADDGK